MSLIANADFIDLYLGPDFCDVRGLNGGGEMTSPPPDWAQELDCLRVKCREAFSEHGEAEFSLNLDGVMLRVTRVVDMMHSDIFVLRRSAAEVRQVDHLPLPHEVINAWRDETLRGLVLISGRMGHGKTSTASGFVIDRLNTFGGLAFAIEDPPETLLVPSRGGARCIQVAATQKNGGFAAGIKKAMRTHADLIFLGEIRDGETAKEALHASVNGHLVLATVHAGSPSETVERMVTLADTVMSDSHKVLAHGLSMIVCQHIERRPALGGNTPIARFTAKHLILAGNAEHPIRAKIESRNFRALAQDVENLSRQGQWGFGGNSR